MPSSSAEARRVQRPSIHEVIAGLPQQQLMSLLKVLMAGCSVQYSGTSTLELKTLAAAHVASANLAGLAMGSDVVALLSQIISGKEVDPEQIADSVKELRAGIRAEVRPDRNVNNTVLDILGATTAYLINYGQGALNKCRKLAPLLKEPAITQNFLADVASQSEFKKPLAKIVKRITGQDGIALSKEDVLALKDQAPEVHREYLNLRQQFNRVWQDELRNYVFQTGHDTVPYAEALAYLDQKKIEMHLDRNFVGRIDANGAWYTTAGRKLNGTPGPGFSVVMNPEYDPKRDDRYVFTTTNDKTGEISQYVYTVDYKKQARDAKFVKVENLEHVIKAVHAKWLPFLKRSDKSPQCVASTALELLYMFSARIGGRGNMADGKSTYGISTLQTGMLKFGPGTCLISYLGKDAVRQKHLIQANASAEAKALLKNLQQLTEGKEPKDPVFTFEENGKQKIMTNTMINAWFRKLGSPVTVHKLRHVKGTELFVQLLEQNAKKIFDRPKPLSQAEADNMLKALATKVGAMLGHVRGVGQQQKATPSTAIANYISPSVMIEYYERLNLRVPKFLEKMNAMEGM